MIYGTGADLAELTRFQSFIGRHARLTHVYGPLELAELRVLPYGSRAATQSFAARFCAKEAFAKALGTGVRGFRLNEVQLLHDSLGRPFFQLDGRALDICKRLSLRLHVSVSHSETCAMAFVIAEQL